MVLPFADNRIHLPAAESEICSLLEAIPSLHQELLFRFTSDLTLHLAHALQLSSSWPSQHQATSVRPSFAVFERLHIETTGSRKAPLSPPSLALLGGSKTTLVLRFPKPSESLSLEGLLAAISTTRLPG
jgi:hypothetical protein